MLSNLSKLLKIKKEHEVKKRTTEFAANMYLIRFRRFQRRKRKTLEGRFRQQIRQYFLTLII